MSAPRSALPVLTPWEKALYVLYIFGAYAASGVWDVLRSGRAAREGARWLAEQEDWKAVTHTAIMRDIESKATRVYVLRRREEEVQRLRGGEAEKKRFRG